MTDSPRPLVLLVDDETPNLDTFQRVFRRDFQIVTARSGSEALQAMARQDFDAILVDFAMPEMNGAQLLIAAAELQPSTVRLMITAHAELPEIQALITARRVLGTIVKPWQRENLLRWIHNAVRITSLRRSAPGTPP